MRWRSKANRLNARKRISHRPRSRFEALAQWALPAIAGVGLAFALWVGWNLFFANHWFAITTISVEGHFKHTSPAQVVGLLPITSGDNLLVADLRGALASLYRHPWIKQARLERRYPHTLVVTVLEEDPIAILSGPRYTYINREGHLFKEVEKGDDMDFPLFVVPARPQLSSPSEEAQKTIDEMIDFLNKYRETRFAFEFGASELIAKDGGFVLFTKKGGLQIEWSKNNIDEELYKLDKYYPDILLSPQHVGVLNLQVKGKIIASAKP